MTNQEFVQQIERWKAITTKARVTLPNGKSLPESFWHVFLGYSWSAYKKHKGSAEDVRTVQRYTAKHLRALSKLEPNVFLDEVRSTIPEFLSEYPKSKKD